MQLSQRLTLPAWQGSLLPGRMGDRVDGCMDQTSITVGVRGQRRVLAHLRRPMSKHHGLESGVSGFGAHRLMNHARKRFDESALQCLAWHFTVDHRRAGLLDRER